MKRAGLIAASLAVSIAASGIVYPATMRVCDIQDGTATLETSTGYTYQVDAEDYLLGDIVSCVMLDTGKPGNIKDDTILSHRFSGWYFEMFDFE